MRKIVLLVLPLIALCVNAGYAQTEINKSNLSKKWIVDKITVNGKVDKENYPTNNDVLDLKSDGTFHMIDKVYDYEQSGKWELTSNNILKLIDNVSNEEQLLKVVELDENNAVMILQDPSPEEIKIFYKKS